MRNILITGGAGFIGSNLSIKLLSKGYNVTVLDNLSTQIHGQEPLVTSPLFQSIYNKVKFIKGTVNSREDWLNAIAGQDCIVHFAAETGTGQSMYEIEKYVNTNIGGTAILLDILANHKHNVTKVVVAESRAIYGEGRYYSEETNQFVFPTERSEEDMQKGDFEIKNPNQKKSLKLVATTEDSKIHPTSVYGITKQVQGQLVHLVCRSLGIQSVSFRYQNVYGPGQSLSNPYTGILSIFSTRIRNGKELYIYEDGKETRDFVYIDDVVDATILGIENSKTSGLAFNIGSGVATNVLTVANTLIRHHGTDVPVKVTRNYRVGDIRHNYADITLAKNVLGYTPNWSFEKGVKKFVNWVKTQEVQNDNYETSILEMKSKGLFK